MMFALIHWICALELALLCCLSASPIRHERSETEMEERLSELKQDLTKHGSCLENMTLYSPMNFNEGCLVSALNCALDQLYALEDNCTLPENSALNVQALLADSRDQVLSLGSSTSSSKCAACKDYNKFGVMQFLENINVLNNRVNVILNV